MFLNSARVQFTANITNLDGSDSSLWPDGSQESNIGGSHLDLLHRANNSSKVMAPVALCHYLYHLLVSHGTMTMACDTCTHHLF